MAASRCRRCTIRNHISNRPAVIGPVKQRLALARAAEHVTGLAVFPDLPDVAADRFPASNLARIFLRRAAAHVIAAIPLKPAARIVLVDPALATPFGERLARIDAETVQRLVTPFRCEFRAREPALGKLLSAVGHVL